MNATVCVAATVLWRLAAARAIMGASEDAAVPSLPDRLVAQASAVPMQGRSHA